MPIPNPIPPADIRLLLVPLLQREEGTRLQVYDDATGQPIGPGYLVRGNPTIGIGRCLATRGITEAEAVELLHNDLDAIMEGLNSSLPWWVDLTPRRQVVLAAMAFQMGLRGLLAFRSTLEAVRVGDYVGAAQGMLQSRWAQQTPGRVGRMAAMMVAG